MKEEENKAIDASSSQRSRKKRRENKNLVIAPSSLLPNDVVEEIFLLLPVKTLIRLKSLSKQWRSTIESRCFSQRHLKISEQSHVDHPKFMAISNEYPLKHVKGINKHTYFGFNTISLETASLYSFTLINFPQEFHNWTYVSESCDGLFCLQFLKTQTIYVVNPATRWLRQLPPSRFQILMNKLNPTKEFSVYIRLVSYLAFVNSSDYKLFWLYNSDDPNEGLNKCEVFDFRANAWRYLTCTSSYRIRYNKIPASANGSLYWFTEPYDGEIKVVALDIHTETFRVLPKINPAIIANSTRIDIDMFTLDNSLCLSNRERDSLIQDIWRLRSSEEDRWEKIFTIDLLPYSFSRTCDAFKWTFNDFAEPSTLMAICKNKKILLSHRYAHNLVKSLSLVSQCPSLYRSYFPSLISHI